MAETIRDVDPHRVTERRIERLTIVIGAISAAFAGALFSAAVAGGVMIGSLLAWVSFRWLEGALDSLVRVSTAKPGTDDARVPLGGMARLIGRYALIVGAVCVIFFSFEVPVLSMLVGLCSLGAAATCASIYELFRPVN
jgi:hypothetical protein